MSMVPEDVRMTERIPISDIRCRTCGSAWGGLVYDDDVDNFYHHDDVVCAEKRRLFPGKVAKY